MLPKGFDDKNVFTEVQILPDFDFDTADLEIVVVNTLGILFKTGFLVILLTSRNNIFEDCS